jgi:hypothetical protein
MFKIENQKHYCVLIDSEKRDYILIKSAQEDILLISRNIYRRAISRDDIKLIRSPEVLYIKGVTLVLTEKEWKKVQKKTAKYNFNELYLWEKRDRFKKKLPLKKKQQKQL